MHKKDAQLSAATHMGDSQYTLARNASKVRQQDAPQGKPQDTLATRRRLSVARSLCVVRKKSVPA